MLAVKYHQPKVHMDKTLPTTLQNRV